MRLTEKQKKELWGESGPYSEAKLSFEHRILDNAVTRVLVCVEVNINPFTYKLIKKNKKDFASDEMVQYFLNYAQYQGLENGYYSSPYQVKFFLDDGGEKLMISEANKALVEVKTAIIRMHSYVIDLIEKPAFYYKLKE